MPFALNMIFCRDCSLCSTTFLVDKESPKPKAFSLFWFDFWSPLLSAVLKLIAVFIHLGFFM